MSQMTQSSRMEVRSRRARAEAGTGTGTGRAGPKQGCRGCPWWDRWWLFLLHLLELEAHAGTRPDHGTMMSSATQLKRFSAFYKDTNIKVKHQKYYLWAPTLVMQCPCHSGQEAGGGPCCCGRVSAGRQGDVGLTSLA